MATDDVLLPAFSLGGYRSFGPSMQRFERFGKVNLLIGPNNCGKSNILRFIQSIYPRLGVRDGVRFEALDNHFPNRAEFRCGVSLSLQLDQEGREYTALNNFLRPLLRADGMNAAGYVLRVFQRKAELDGTKSVWFTFQRDQQLVEDNWPDAFATLSDRELSLLWHNLTGQGGGSRQQHWYPESLARLKPNWKPVGVALIPAIRRIGSQATEPHDFGGEGLIERLARLQNPDVHAQSDKMKFARINTFLKSVTDNESAAIEIPYARDTIIVHLDGKSLPLESLGTGLHEVIVLAAAATILENTVVCMEEPELHLNPILQKKLVRYLGVATNNQYFITTHSAALMDTPAAEIYHVQLEGGQSVVERVTSDKARSAVCEDLGYHPSDLLQANCVIWVEGPSDRTYLNRWIRERDPELLEGVHYSIMFYGGRLASHLTANDPSDAINDFISLRRLNRRASILIDSDLSTTRRKINATKSRLVEEFDSGPGFAWVTAGREIENYLPPEYVRAALKAVTGVDVDTEMGQYDSVLRMPDESKVPKVEIAKFIATQFRPDETRLDLAKQLDALLAFIKDSNPRSLRVAG